MNPAIGPPVIMNVVLLGVPTMCTIPECLVSVAQLLTTGFHLIFILPQDCATDGFDKFTYPHYGGFITIPHTDTTPSPYDFVIMNFENNTWRLSSPLPCVIRPLLEGAFLPRTPYPHRHWPSLLWLTLNPSLMSPSSPTRLPLCQTHSCLSLHLRYRSWQHLCQLL